jgi:hypothetical protein
VLACLAEALKSGIVFFSPFWLQAIELGDGLWVSDAIAGDGQNAEKGFFFAFVGKMIACRPAWPIILSKLKTCTRDLLLDPQKMGKRTFAFFPPKWAPDGERTVPTIIDDLFLVSDGDLYQKYGRYGWLKGNGGAIVIINA